MKPMYSSEWFETYSATVPASIIEADLRGITATFPLDRYPRILDVGCGIGRISGPLSAQGYSVTGLDVSVDALRTAHRRASGPQYVALDQRHIGQLKWVFDGALFLWNSLGFVGRSADLETLAGVAAALRPGGSVVFDLYHPDWLQKNDRSGEPDDRGAASVRRWTRDGRCFHEIKYANGQVDDIQFNVYRPEEIRDLSRRVGLEPGVEMVWWSSESRPSPGSPRYQLICTRPE
jgi:SAM-dependent methyltransferase